jgi:(2Fe-2S) ferredoxin
MYERHVFVCTNVKEGGKRSCGTAGSAEICERLKAAAKTHPALQGRAIRINKSGCLGLCEEGPTVVVYPEGVWYTGVVIGDVPEILEQHVVNGQPVVRLLRKKDAAKPA